MPDLPVRYAGVSYYDKTRALERGDVSPRGVELDYVQYDNVGELFRVVAQDPTVFDASEMSLSTLTMMIDRGDRRLVGIPIFPSKAFRHSQVYVNATSGIERPQDLVGRKVGVPEYQMTAAVWIRAFLEDDYGVAPGDIRWFSGGVETPHYKERLHHDPPPGVSIELIPEGETLVGMLASGGLDALAHAHQPSVFRDGSGRVRRLFPDYRPVEEDYLRRTGFYPIMHTVTIQRAIYERQPDVALALLEAFDEARRLGRARLRNLDTTAVMHPWVAAELDELKGPFAAFGGDPFAYGIGPNRAVLEALMGYSHRQGLSSRLIGLEELFAPETLDWAPEPVLDEPPA